MENKKKIIISKSKYMSGLQCPKYMWYQVHAREDIPEPDFSTRFMFHQGHLVGEYAKKLFPDGIDLGKMRDIREQLEKTRAVLAERKPVFEASISSGNVYSRVDILKPAPGDTWDIIEVKSATTLKEDYIKDVAFQKYTFLDAGIKIDNCYLAVINSDYVKNGDIDPEELFYIHDITEQADELLKDMPERLDGMIKMLESPEPPDVQIGRQCESPYTCPLKDKCWEHMPDNNVFKLYGNKDRALKLCEKGILSIDDIPEDYDLTLKQEIQRECAASKKPYIDRGQIVKFLERLKEPLYFFDFETYSTAIPIYEGTRPFQRIPFQYSIHITDGLYGETRHHDFLASGSGDPRKELLENLKEHLGDSGSIIVYYEFFEKGILRELAEKYPEYSEWVESILPRIIDLYRPFGDFYYYNSIQQGSASVKNVLPAITKYSYKEMDIADGLSASVYFLYACGHYQIGESCPSPQEIEKIRKDLITYCRMDTGGMIHILRGLKDVLENKV